MAGKENVGKSSLIARYVDDVFSENMKSTIGVAFKRKKIYPFSGNNEDLYLEFSIWDFGGEEKYRTLFPSYVNGAMAALILYDTTNKETLEDVHNWIEIIDNNQDDVVKVMIGTKIDLKDQKEISREEAQKVSDEAGCFGQVVETSSKTGENVEQAFLTVAREIVSKKLQLCENCEEYYAKKLKFCSHCGKPRLNVTFS